LPTNGELAAGNILEAVWVVFAAFNKATGFLASTTYGAIQSSDSATCHLEGERNQEQRNKHNHQAGDLAEGGSGTACAVSGCYGYGQNVGQK
jgi:hypothetical protein